MASFFKKMIEEKDLLAEVIVTEVEHTTIVMDVSELLDYIEIASEKEQAKIKDTFSKIDFANGDLMHYLTFLAQALVKQQIHPINGCSYKGN